MGNKTTGYLQKKTKPNQTKTSERIADLRVASEINFKCVTPHPNHPRKQQMGLFLQRGRKREPPPMGCGCWGAGNLSPLPCLSNRLIITNIAELAYIRISINVPSLFYLVRCTRFNSKIYLPLNLFKDPFLRVGFGKLREERSWGSLAPGAGRSKYHRERDGYGKNRVGHP